MKYLIISTVFLLAFFSLSAQDDNEKISGITGDSKDRLIMELNWHYWLVDDSDQKDLIDPQAKSRGFNFYFFYDIAIGGDNFAIAPGLGMAFPNSFHNSYLGLDSLENSVFNQFPDSIDVRKNKLSISYLEIPVEIRFRTNKNSKGKRFKFAVGFKGGLRIADKSKYIGMDYRPTADPDYKDDVKFKEFRNRNLNLWRYGLTARFGYDNINVQAFYGLSEVFESDKGPKINQLTIGISFNPF